MESLFAWTYDHGEAMDPLLFARIYSKERLKLPCIPRPWLGVAGLKPRALDNRETFFYLKTRITWQVYAWWCGYLEPPR